MNHLLKYADMKKVIKGNFVSFYLFFQLKKIKSMRVAKLKCETKTDFFWMVINYIFN